MAVIETNPATSTVPTSGRTLQRVVRVSVAEMLALFATPKTLVPAPGAGFALVLDSISFHKPAGAAYAGVAAGEDLSVKYTNAAGAELAGCEATGFLDQATAQTRHAHAYRAASGVSQITPVANAALVLHMLIGEITTGDSPLDVQVNYKVVPATTFAA